MLIFFININYATNSHFVRLFCFTRVKPLWLYGSFRLPFSLWYLLIHKYRPVLHCLA